MATLTLHSRRDADGHRVHPVARVRVTIPRDDDEPLVLRLTLRSDGAILRQHRSPGSPEWGIRPSWSQPSIWTTTTTGFPCCGAGDATARALADLATRRFPAATVEQEAIR